MKSLKRDLAAMLDTLKYLTRKAEEMQKRLRTVEKTLAARMAGKRASRSGQRKPMGRMPDRAMRTTAITAVFGIIRRSRKGVTTLQLAKKTGFGEKKIWNVITRLKSQGLVKNLQKGIYAKI